jgi:hypothetical protein
MFINTWHYGLEDISFRLVWRKFLSLCQRLSIWWVVMLGKWVETTSSGLKQMGYYVLISGRRDEERNRDDRLVKERR